MICVGPAYQGWLGSGSRRTWQIKSLIIKLVRSLGLRPCINGTSFSRSAKRRSSDGGLTWLTLWPRLLLMYVARSAELHDALTDDDDVCLDSDDNARGFLQLRLARTYGEL